jgi:hypothetical protein
MALAHIAVSEAKRAHRLAADQARAAGVEPKTVSRAIKMLFTDPEVLNAEQERLGAILTAIRAPGVVITQGDLFDAAADESASERAERIEREGYFSAVLAKPREGEDADWLRGYDRFLKDLEAFEKECP